MEEHSFILYVVVAMDLLWFTRNQRVHKSTQPDPIHLLQQIQKCHKEHLTAYEEKAKYELKVWVATANGFVKTNADATVRTSSVTIACLCSNS